VAFSGYPAQPGTVGGTSTIVTGLKEFQRLATTLGHDPVPLLEDCPGRAHYAIYEYSPEVVCDTEPSRPAIPSSEPKYQAQDKPNLDK